MTKFVKLQGMKVIYLYTDVTGRPKNKKKMMLLKSMTKMSRNFLK